MFFKHRDDIKRRVIEDDRRTIRRIPKTPNDPFLLRRVNVDDSCQRAHRGTQRIFFWRQY